MSGTEVEEVREIIPGTDLPRAKMPNPYNYTNMQLAKRKRDLKALTNDYPGVNPMWAEWIYDVIENMPHEEVEEIVNKGLWEGPSKFHTAPGGILNSVECFNEDGTPYVFPEVQKIPDVDVEEQ